MASAHAHPAPGRAAWLNSLFVDHALLRVAWRFRARGWYRRFPFLPLPAREYVRWRMYTAYGESDAVPPAEDPGAAARALQVAVAEAQRRLDEARDSELARLMEQSLAATMEGRDLLAELRANAEAALAAARARLTTLEAT